MLLSLFNCHLTYFLICSSSRPTVLTQYPLAQKCRPQYRLFNSKCLSNILIALFPFKKPTTSEIECLDGTQRSKWTWSACTFPSNISIFFHSHNCFIISRTEFPTPPVKILNRYFGHHTICYLHSHTACANLLKCFTEYLLLKFRVTYPFLKEVFIFCKSLSYKHSKAWTISLADGLMG